MTIPAPSIDLLWQPGVPEPYFTAARIALERATMSLGIADRLPVTTIGVYAEIGNVLNVARGLATCIGKPGQAHVDVVTLWLAVHRWRPKEWNGFSMLIVNDDYAVPDDDFVFGSASAGIGGSVSISRFINDVRVCDRLGLFEMMVMHEIGHALSAADPDRGSAIQLWLGSHCTNMCVMQQRDDLPEFETDVLVAMNADQPFCPECTRDVRRFLGGHLAT